MKKTKAVIKEWLFPSLGLVLAFWGLILTYWGISITKSGNENADRISKQEQKIKGFDLLLSNSNKTIDKLNLEIDVLNEQLKLNELSQKEANRNSEYADEANMNLLISAVYRLSQIIETKETVAGYDTITKQFFITGIKEILESQLTNPYLFKNNTVAIAWVKAYNQLYYYVAKPKGSFSNDFDNSFETRQKRRLDEINPNPNEDISSCWDAANKAYEMALSYLKKDRRFLKTK